jgi:hypothetical protein
VAVKRCPTGVVFELSVSLIRTRNLVPESTVNSLGATAAFRTVERRSAGLRLRCANVSMVPPMNISVSSNSKFLLFNIFFMISPCLFTALSIIEQNSAARFG